MNANSTNLSNTLALKLDITKKDSKHIVEAFIETLIETLSESEKLQILGLGTFSVKERAERNGINPATKEPIVIPARKVLTFKPSPTLKERINA